MRESGRGTLNITDLHSLNGRECRNVVLNPVKVLLNSPWFLKTLMIILVNSREIYRSVRILGYCAA